MQDNSEYLGLLNHWLHKLEESGIKERMWKKWTYKASEEFWFEMPVQLGFGNYVFVFISVMGVIALSTFIAFCEKIVDKGAKCKSQSGLT